MPTILLIVAALLVIFGFPVLIKIIGLWLILTILVPLTGTAVIILIIWWLVFK